MWEFGGAAHGVWCSLIKTVCLWIVITHVIYIYICVYCGSNLFALRINGVECVPCGCLVFVGFCGFVGVLCRCMKIGEWPCWCIDI